MSRRLLAGHRSGRDAAPHAQQRAVVKSGEGDKEEASPPTMVTRTWLTMEEKKRAQQRLQWRRRIVLERRSHACRQHTQQSRWNDRRPEWPPPGSCGVQTSAAWKQRVLGWRRLGSDSHSGGVGDATTRACWWASSAVSLARRSAGRPSRGKARDVTQRRLGEELGAMTRREPQSGNEQKYQQTATTAAPRTRCSKIVE
jgi:hypothetical protein